MGTMTASEYGLKYGISKQWASKLAADGRIPGAVLKDRVWVIPGDAGPPVKLRRGRVPSATSSRALRAIAAAEKREVESAALQMAMAGIKKTPNLSRRDIWWRDTLDGGFLAVQDRWIEINGDVIGCGWAADEDEDSFKNRCAAWRTWTDSGFEEDLIPEDWRLYCEKRSRE